MVRDLLLYAAAERFGAQYPVNPKNQRFAE